MATKVNTAETQYQKQLNKAINQNYQSGLNYLNQQTANLQAYQPEYEKSLAGIYESQAPQLQQAAQQQVQGLQQQQEQTRAQREDVLSQARRQYEQAQQRTQQLYGGVAGSSAGQASSDILGSQLQKQTGQAMMGANQQIAGLQTNIGNVQADVANKLVALDAQKQQALSQAKDQFRQQLDAINSQRYQLAQDKANKQISALQDFNARRRQLEDFYTQAKQSLETYRQQQQIGLGTYAQQLALASRYNVGSTTSVPDLTQYGYNDQARLQEINKLQALPTSTLNQAGYNIRPYRVGNQDIQALFGPNGTVYNTYTGERIK